METFGTEANQNECVCRYILSRLVIETSVSYFAKVAIVTKERNSRVMSLVLPGGVSRCKRGLSGCCWGASINS